MAWQRRAEEKRQLWHAWHVAALAPAAFVGKLPRLTWLFGEMPEKPKPQTWQEQKAALRMLTAPFQKV